LELAAAWADRHYLDPAGGEYHPVVERACAFGGEGTPEVSEYCAAELGALQGIGMFAGPVVDRGCVGFAVSAAAVVGAGGHGWGAGLAGAEGGRGHPGLVVGGGIESGPCAE
jgi:hypothetical protein